MEKIRISYNLFVEHHGKNECDSHFGFISQLIKQEGYKRQLTSCQDILNTILNHQIKSNNEREKAALKPIFTYPLIHNFNNENIIKVKCVRSLNSYYNFFTDKNFLLRSTILTDHVKSNSIKSYTRTKKSNIKIKSMNTQIKQISTNFKMLKKKNILIKNNLELTNNICQNLEK